MIYVLHKGGIHSPEIYWIKGKNLYVVHPKNRIDNLMCIFLQGYQICT